MNKNKEFYKRYKNNVVIMYNDVDNGKNKQFSKSIESIFKNNKIKTVIFKWTIPLYKRLDNQFQKWYKENGGELRIRAIPCVIWYVEEKHYTETFFPDGEPSYEESKTIPAHWHIFDFHLDSDNPRTIQECYEAYNNRGE